MIGNSSKLVTTTAYNSYNSNASAKRYEHNVDPPVVLTLVIAYNSNKLLINN